jgi:hypothetical protein
MVVIWAQGRKLRRYAFLTFFNVPGDVPINHASKRRRSFWHRWSPQSCWRVGQRDLDELVLRLILEEPGEITLPAVHGE